ncbi:MAG: hypothetical protein PWP15_1146 [Methanothermococcus sp.]|uniref:hypothetical protein n=1 Tax=Methanothermococcus sp. TaxID=2614238 RepID=UPI0025878329|nr:hypothetical protein [Methanothermococcus sp.]MDK2790639.1 hypothetical protein [Methanothermococcus sp.]
MTILLENERKIEMFFPAIQIENNYVFLGESQTFDLQIIENEKSSFGIEVKNIKYLEVKYFWHKDNYTIIISILYYNAPKIGIRIECLKEELPIMKKFVQTILQNNKKILCKEVYFYERNNKILHTWIN